MNVRRRKPARHGRIRTVVPWPPPNIPAAKRAGLPVDLDRLATEGDGWLTPEDRYALKTYGVCTQLQAHVFMVRVRIPGGVLPTGHARGAARLAARHGEDWLHLTTRQNVELHWVADRRCPRCSPDRRLRAVDALGVRPHAAQRDGVRGRRGRLDEPFDCLPDARMVSDALIARSAS